MKKNVCFITAVTALLLATSSLFGQNITTRMDSGFDVQSHNGLLNGNLLVAEKGRVIYQRSFGFSNVATHQPNTAASAFALASISKQLTATAVLQLKEKNKLRLEDHFVQYFPDFPFPEITIRQLLNHTSGLPEYELFDALTDKEPGRIFTNKDVIPALKVWTKGLYFKPGDDWRYSSMNYCLLALLIEKLSDETLQAYLAKYIFAPSGMHQTYLENLLIKTNNPNRTINYEYPTYYAPNPVPVDSVSDEHRMIFNMGGFSGQGGLTSTAEDLLRFDNAFFSGKLINTNDIAEALTPVKLNNGKIARAQNGFGDLGSSGYGLGWFILNDTTKGKIVWHDGGRPGVSTVHLHNLRTDQTFVLLENAAENPHEPVAWAFHLVNKEPAQIMRISAIRAYSLALVTEGVDAATIKLQFLRSDPAYKMPEDWQWVQLSYQLGANKEYAPLAIEELRTATLVYPEKNWYIDQGYAIALEKAGKKELAVLLYKKCLTENPGADYAAGRLKALESK